MMLMSATQPLLCRRLLLRQRHDPKQQGSTPIAPTSTRTHDFLMLTGMSHVCLADNSTLTHLHLFLQPAPSPLLCPTVVPPIRPIQQHTSPPLRPTWRPPLSLFFLASTGLNRPFRLSDSLSSWPSWIPKGCSRPSGQDVLARQLSHRPILLMFALVWAPLQQRIDFALALSWSTSARLLICGSISGINEDTLKVHLTHLILYDLTLTLSHTFLGVQRKRKGQKGWNKGAYIKSIS